MRRDYIEPLPNTEVDDENYRLRPFPTEAGVALRQHYVDKYFS